MSDERVVEKLDLIVNELGGIKVILTKQEVNLQDHMRRTELLEAAQFKHEEENKESYKELDKRIDPLYDRKVMMDGVLKFLGVLGIIGSFIGGTMKFLGYFN